MVSDAERWSTVLLTLAWLVAVVGWVLWLRVRTGRVPIARPRAWTERAWPVVGIAWLAGALAVGSAPDPCAPACLFQAGTLSLPGQVLGWSGLALASWGSWSLGTSWRIGVDEEHPGPVVSRGAYRLSRNPIFAGMLVSGAGLVLVAPTLPLLALWVATFVVVRRQVVREEAFLSEQFGPAYVAYARRVRRWL